jgi:tetratricopeptide (TPR) repeat protein
VKGRVILLLILLGSVASPADVVHLKNGRTIWADRVREQGGHIEYDVGDNSYAIPKSLVQSIEAGGVPPEIASPGGGSESGHDLPTFAPADEIVVDADLPSKIVREGHVDSDALLALESTAKPEIVAAGYFIAGKHEFDKGNMAQARRHFEAALHFQPTSPTILNYCAATLVRLGMAKEALSYAERSTRLSPNSADAFAVLGFVQFASDHNQEAIRSWKRSLELRPDPAVREYIEKAEREAKAEADFTERASNHFTLRFEGKNTSESFRRSLLITLEAEYDELVRVLGVAPRENIAVVLYTDKAFFDVTQAPSWSGALNDGKLRIPVNGMDNVTPDLARVLKHELAHSFINQISHGRCPQWLHEGIAQAIEPKSLNNDGQRLAKLFQAQQEIPFNTLEGPFINFSSPEAVLAYDESLAAVQYISDTYGISELRRILERIGDGSSTEAAMRSTIHSDYRQLQNEVGKFLNSKYGS